MAKGMSRSNEEIVRAGYEAWNRGDFEALVAELDPEIEWKLPDEGMNTGTFRGHAGVMGLMESYLDAFEHFTVELERLSAAGDQVVVFVRARARGKASGVEVETRPAHLWTMRGGKAVRMEVYPEREQALEAAGLAGAA